MNYLIKGGESAQRLELLFKLGRFGDPIKSALTNHYVTGYEVDASAALAGVKQSNLSVAMAALEEKAAIVEKIKDEDWQKERDRQAAKVDLLHEALRRIIKDSKTYYQESDSLSAAKGGFNVNHKTAHKALAATISEG